ncbi:MAG: hypothetical protein JWP09_575 [Candidatus Taylorbacteria bacterium]|nr:hypothetical protein [Candidatus Taylorbacteria bacterium]
MKKPSKKIIILLSFCFALVIIIAFVKSHTDSEAGKTDAQIKQDQTPVENIDAGASNVKNIDDISTLDTDKDGLPDWQEALLGTDPNNPDTDGDGTKDGEEVKLNRDPLKAGPNDAAGQKPTIDPNNPSGDAESMSDEVSRKIFSTLAYVSSDTPLTQDSQQNIIDDVMGQIQTSFKYKEYPESGLSYIDKETPETIKFYGDIFASLQVKLILDMGKNVTAIQGDFSVLAKMYQKQADNLYTIKVPKEMSEEHLDVVNNFSKSAAVYMAIANEKKDPLALPFAVSTYQKAAADQLTSLTKVANFLKNNGIVYTSDEAGGYWNTFE